MYLNDKQLDIISKLAKEQGANPYFESENPEYQEFGLTPTVLVKFGNVEFRVDPKGNTQIRKWENYTTDPYE
jgi:hypothetical protein